MLRGPPGPGASDDALSLQPLLQGPAQGGLAQMAGVVCLFGTGCGVYVCYRHVTVIFM